MKNESYIYFHINPLTNKVFYVGKGTKNRAYNKDNRNTYWYNTVNKYGYIVDIVEDNLTDDISLQREKFYINKIGRNNLVNLTDGGEGKSGSIHSKETKEKISKSQKDNSYWSGKKHSKETKEKISINNGNSIKCIYNGEIFPSKKQVWRKYFNNIHYDTFKERCKYNKIDITIYLN